jgi:hypothetical protein
MKNRNVLSKSLAIIGSLLVWIPLLAPIVFSLALLTRTNMRRFDYLMPAELFPAALLGGALLVWTTYRSHTRQSITRLSFCIAVFLLFGGQLLAVLTGLASGEMEPTGWPWVTVLGTLIGYALALVVLGIGGLLLVRDLFKTHKPDPAN